MIKTKISIGILILAAFIAGGFALNAIKSDAFWGLKGSGEISEEVKAKMEEFRVQCQEEGDCLHPRKFKIGVGPFKIFNNDEMDHQVIELENGVQITITSDNQESVEKLHDMAKKMESRLIE